MKFKELLKSKGIKQNWLARRLGVSNQALSGWVSGRMRPSYENLVLMADILNSTNDEILACFLKKTASTDTTVETE